MWRVLFVDEDAERLADIVDKFANPDLDIVVSAYDHALFSRLPRDRYLCGGDAKFFALLSILPSWVVDLVLKVIMPKTPCPAVRSSKARAG